MVTRNIPHHWYKKIRNDTLQEVIKKTETRISEVVRELYTLEVIKSDFKKSKLNYVCAELEELVKEFKQMGET